jgi:hypothetical protein
MALAAGALLRSSASNNSSTSSPATTPACTRAINHTCLLRQAPHRCSNKSRRPSRLLRTSLMESHLGQAWASPPCSLMPRDSTQSPPSTETTASPLTLTCQARASSTSTTASKASSTGRLLQSATPQHQPTAATMVTTRMLRPCRTTLVPTIAQMAPRHHPLLNLNGPPNECNDGLQITAFPKTGRRHSERWDWKARGFLTLGEAMVPKAMSP